MVYCAGWLQCGLSQGLTLHHGELLWDFPLKKALARVFAAVYVAKDDQLQLARIDDQVFISILIVVGAITFVVLIIIILVICLVSVDFFFLYL